MTFKVPFFTLVTYCPFLGDAFLASPTETSPSLSSSIKDLQESLLDQAFDVPLEDIAVIRAMTLETMVPAILI